MQIITDLTNINTILETFIAEDEATSFGFVPIFNDITAHDVISIKKAQKLLDICIIQNISNQKLSKKSFSTLQQLNVNLVIDYIETSNTLIQINLGIHSINSSNLFKGLLTILPSSVFINQNNFDIFQALQKINSEFPDLFILENTDTPVSLRESKEIEILRQLHFLEKSKQEINRHTITKTLYDYSVIDYFEYIAKNDKFVNLTIADLPKNINFTYCFTATY